MMKGRDKDLASSAALLPEVSAAKTTLMQRGNADAVARPASASSAVLQSWMQKRKSLLLSEQQIGAAAPVGRGIHVNS